MSWCFKKKIKSGLFEISSHTLIDRINIKKLIKYINSVYNDYIYYGSYLTNNIFLNKNVLEIGPGDNLGVAVKIMISGAKNVVCVDKFYVRSNNKKKIALYQELRNSINRDLIIKFDKIINISNDRTRLLVNIHYFYGKGIEEALTLFNPGSFDLIISRSVLEHIFDINKVFEVMDKLLIRGGYFLHKIDFRDHGMFSKGCRHPLTFLTINNNIYNMMTKYSGGPNRKLIQYYRNKIRHLNYESRIFITSILGKEKELIPHKEKIIYDIDYNDYNISLIKKIRPLLTDEFKKLSDENLLVTGIFLIGKKSE